MKSWSYKKITQKAEEEITSLMRPGNDEEFDRKVRRNWAYGVFLGWRSLTMGYMNEGDYERLQKLTEGISA